MEGWVKLHRKIIENPIFSNAHLYHLYSYCLLKANHKEKEIMFNGELIKIGAGQFITGRNIISSAVGEKPNTTYKRLKNLEKMNFLSLKSNNQYTVVTVANWDVYQSEEKKVTTKSQPSNNEVTTESHKQECKNDNNDNNNNTTSAPSQSKTDINNFFESVWALYPKKRGKDAVGYKKRKELYLLGFEKLSKAIDRYKSECDDMKFMKNGSSFFNTGYSDFLDGNYVPLVKSKKKTVCDVPQAINFEQREYSAEDFEKYYYKVPVEEEKHE